MSGRRHAKARSGRRAKAGSRAPSASKSRVAAPWARATASRAQPTAKVKVKARSKATAKPASRPSTASAGGPRGRAAAETRRKRVPLALAAVAAVVILATSFPATVLFGQHRQLSAAAAQLTQLRHENALLSEQQQQLNSTAEVKRLAQQNYQLVPPGRSLFVILPPAGQAATAGSSDGDPANQPLVSPSQAPNMTPDPGLPAVTPPTGSGTTTSSAPTGSTRPAPAGFWSRVTSSLQFWK